MAAAAPPPRFPVPPVPLNPEGWGPTTVPEHLKDVPYAPFGRNDKLGRAADWIGAQFGAKGDRFAADRFGRGRAGDAAQPQVNTVFSFFAGDDEDSFQLVENKPVTKPRFGGRQRYQQHRFQRKEVETAKGRDVGQGIERERARQAQKMRKNQQWHSFTYRQNEQQRVTLSASIEVRPEWTMVEQYSLGALSKLPGLKGPFPAEDLYACGQVYPYNRRLDRVTPKATVDLYRAKLSPLTSGAESDTVLQRLASEKAGFVYTTDAVFATLVCAARSNYSWDLVVNHYGTHVFIDRRDGSGFEYPTVNETAQDPIPDDPESMNGMQQLSAEAMGIERSFMESSIDTNGTPTPMGAAGDNPHAASASLPQGYRYRKWKLDADTGVVVRCTVDATSESRGQVQNTTLRVVNEFDSRVQGALDFRKNIENQRGAVLATELKNNQNKIAKWTCCALLAGTEQIKLGFATRTHPKDPRNHVLVAMQAYKPKDFAAQIALKEENMFAVLKGFVDKLRTLKQGKYLFVKDPNKPILRLYQVSGGGGDGGDFFA